MKKIIALVTVLAMVMALVLVAAPVMAAKPQAYFTTRITIDGNRGPGDINGNFVIKTGGDPTAAQHVIGLMDTDTNMNLSGMYPFYLQASADQQSALTAYFSNKAWYPTAGSIINAEINGSQPFFWVNVTGGVYTLVDNFRYSLGPMYAPYPVTVDDDYPVGKYVYSGTLGTLPMSITLKVVR